MRPYFVLIAVVLMAGAAFAQQPFPRPDGACYYGCGPFVPLVSTPMISLQTVSRNPVGASNATTGLTAGATNSTVSEIQGSTSSVYTQPVWYQGGGAPLTTSQIHMFPEPAGREHHMMHEMMMRDGMHDEHAPHAEARAGWTYFTGWEHSTDAAQAASAAKTGKKAAHVYTNDDVQRENDKNGTVKYDGKTEKL